MDTKICSICEVEKELSEYYAQNKTKANGEQYIYHPPYCKDCTTKKANDSYKSNREEGIKYRRLDYQVNRERYLAQHREYDRKNRLKRRDYFREWQSNNPEKVKEYNAYRTMNKTHEITVLEWEKCKEYFNNECAYCGLKAEDHLVLFKGENILSDLHKEHVIHDGINDLSNCIPSCKSCNVQKRTIPFLEWYSSTNENFDQERFDKILQWMLEDYKLYIQ